MSRAILCPLPDRDFDVTEVAVPWKLLTEAGFEVVFATEEGKEPAADPLLLDGGIFRFLGARPEPIRFYREMETTEAFMRPVAYRDLDPSRFGALLLPGGHGPGMRQYLGSEGLQRWIGDYWSWGRPVAAICHGVLPLARSQDPRENRSVLHGVKTTCLPKYLECTGYAITGWKLGKHYRTYPAYVEDEVVSALGDPSLFHRGPFVLSERGTRDDDGPAFTVQDGRYLSARWPGDAYLFAKRFITLITTPTAHP